MTAHKERVVVLGAGPTGLAAAWRLVSEGYPVTVIEKEPHVGGLSGSFRWRGHTLDYGPHTFHVKEPAMTELVRSFYRDDPDTLLEGTKNIYVYLRGKMFHYPLSAMEVLLRLNPFFTARAIFDFLMVSALYRIIYVSEDNFESWGIKRFGKALYNLCFGAYTEKVWKMSAKRISHKFASDRVRGMDFKELLRRMLRIQGQTILMAFWTDWLYPKGGSFDLYERMRRAIEAKGGEVLTDSSLARVRTAEGKVRSVECTRGGETRSVPCGRVVSTVPLNALIRALDPPPSDFVLYHASKLHYRSLLVACMEVEGGPIHDAQWFYLLDPQFECNRVSLQYNVSPATMREGTQIVSFEITCAWGDALWNRGDEEIIAMARRDMERIKFMRGRTIVHAMVARVRDAYEVYDLDFDRHLDVVMDRLADIGNCISTGRKGLFLQNDIHDSMKMGIEAAERIIGRAGAPSPGA